MKTRLPVVVSSLLLMANVAAAQTARVAETSKLRFASFGVRSDDIDAEMRSNLSRLLGKSDRAVAVRVFAGNSSDLAAAQAALQKQFARSKGGAPALSLVGVLGFADSTQRIAVELVSEGTNALNPNGLAFLGGLATPSPDRLVRGFRRVLQDAAIDSARLVRLSCFTELPDSTPSLLHALNAAFPGASTTIVMNHEPETPPAIECEAVAQLPAGRQAPGSAAIVRGFKGRPASPFYSIAALVNGGKLLFLSGLTSDAQSATAMFDAARTVAARNGGELKNVVVGENYWIQDSGKEAVHAARQQYFGDAVPAATGVFFKSRFLPAAVAGVDLVIATGVNEVAVGG